MRLKNTYSSPYPINTGVFQGSSLGPLLFLIFINDISNSIKFSHHLLYADDLKIFRKIASPTDCHLLQNDIQFILSWSKTNGMEINRTKTQIISFTRKTNWIKFEYKLNGIPIPRTACINDLGVLLDSKLYFHSHVDYLFSTSIKMLGLIRVITYNFNNIHCLITLYKSIIRSKLEYCSCVWNSITSTDSYKIERLQNKFLKLCCKRLNCLDSHNIDTFAKTHNCENLSLRRKGNDALLVFNIIHQNIDCKHLLEAIHFKIPRANARNHDMLQSSNCKLCPISRCIIAANHFNKSVDLLSFRHLKLGKLIVTTT